MRLKHTLAILAVLLLIPCTGSVPYMEHPERQAILAEQFAVFTEASGFDGVFISDHLLQNSIQRILGNFSDISISVDMDDAALKPIFDDLVSRIMPVLQAREKPVFDSFVKDEASVTAIYRQIVNGYEVVLRGSVKIKYYLGRQYFVTYDETIDFDTSKVEPKLSKEDAIAIWEENVPEEFRQSEENSEPIAHLAYYDTCLNVFIDRDVKLCWLVSGERYCLIDAQSGKVYQTRPAPYRYTPL